MRKVALLAWLIWATTVFADPALMGGRGGVDVTEIAGADSDAAKLLIGQRVMGGAAATHSTIALGSNAIGLLALASDGTETLDLDDADGPWVNHATGITLNNIAGHNLTGGPYASGDMSIATKTDLVFVVKTGPASTDVTDVRIMVGARTVVMSAAVVDSGHNVGHMMFRYSTAVPDTTWKTTTRGSDGVGGNETIKDTGLAIAANTLYILRIDARDSTAVKFYINGILYTTHGGVGEFLPEADDIMVGQWKIHNLSGGTDRNMKWRKYYQVSGPWD